MKFRGPKALGNRRQKTIVCPPSLHLRVGSSQGGEANTCELLGGRWCQLRYFMMMSPVVALTTATKPSLEVPKSMTQTGAGNREAAPREREAGFWALSFSLSQSAAFAVAALYAASES